MPKWLSRLSNVFPKGLNNVSNVFMKPLLRSPLHSVASGRTLLITFTGHKTGTTYTTPVDYVQRGDKITIVTRKERTWWKNLHGSGAPVRLRLQGRDVDGIARVEFRSPEAAIHELRAMYPRMSEARAAHLALNVVVVHVILAAERARAAAG